MSELDDIFREFALSFIGRIKVEQEVAFPDLLPRQLLKGTLASLKYVDSYLNEVHSRRGGLAEPEWHTTVLWGGAYVGEVIRHETKKAYRWVDYDEYMPAHPDLMPMIPERTTATCAFLVLGESSMSMPLNKIARYIAEGETHSTHYFASLDIRRAQEHAKQSG